MHQYFVSVVIVIGNSMIFNWFVASVNFQIDSPDAVQKLQAMANAQFSGAVSIIGFQELISEHSK